MTRALIFSILFLFLAHHISYSKNTDSITSPINYTFIIKDVLDAYPTMNQFNQNYSSMYRMLARGLNQSFSENTSQLIQVGLSLFLQPLTHEEGHRSILTYKNIGAISKPYPSSAGAAYVCGVTDQTLQDLRDSDLPSYIRLHSAGIESDYMLSQEMEKVCIFEMDEYKNMQIEYIVRKLSYTSYLFTSGIRAFDINIIEEDNELDRDIVGHDVFGTTRHLFRPEMSFERYTDHSELTEREQDFIKRIAKRSVLNLFHPMIIGISSFEISDNINASAGLGYMLAPFGDMMDENIWLKINDKANLHLYCRQFQNRETWFPAAGIRLINYPLSKKFSTSLSGHIWSQPEDLSFNTDEGKIGGSGDISVQYAILSPKESKISSYYFNIGYRYKSFGFLPGDLFLEEHSAIHIGSSISF